MKYAWIENDRIRDIAPGNPADLYHPDIAKFYDTEVPTEAASGDGWVNGELVKPAVATAPVEPPPPPEPEAPKVSPVQFKLLFTSPERIAIKVSADPAVQDFFEIVNDPRLTHVDLGLQSTKDALSYLVSLNLITEERKTEILIGRIH